jgi:hypothetical protein
MSRLPFLGRLSNKKLHLLTPMKNSFIISKSNDSTLLKTSHPETPFSHETPPSPSTTSETTNTQITCIKAQSQSKKRPGSLSRKTKLSSKLLWNQSAMPKSVSKSEVSKFQLSWEISKTKKAPWIWALFPSQKSTRLIASDSLILNSFWYFTHQQCFVQFT